MHKAQQHVNLHTNNGMGKRNVFYDDNGKEIAVWITANDSLYIEIKDGDAVSNIALSKVDAVVFILDLYRMKRLLVDEKP
jgi:hypothetical protein